MDDNAEAGRKLVVKHGSLGLCLGTLPQTIVWLVGVWLWFKKRMLCDAIPSLNY